MATPRGGYFTAAGEKVPSVTTILSRFKDSGGLMFWAHGVGAEQRDVIWRNRICKWADDQMNRPGTLHTGDVQFDKLISAENLELIEQRKWAPAPESTRLYDVSEKAAAAGTLAHDAIEAFIKAKGDPEFSHKWGEADPDTLAKAQNAYLQFLSWFSQARITITHTETGGVSEKYKFGGTFDGLGKDDQGRWVLLDWKTSGKIYSDMLLQLAAYSILLEETMGIKTERHYIVRVAKEDADFNHGSYTDLEHEKQTFILMRELYDRVKKTEGRCK